MHDEFKIGEYIRIGAGFDWIPYHGEIGKIVKIENYEKSPAYYVLFFDKATRPYRGNCFEKISSGEVMIEMLTFYAE